MLNAAPVKQRMSSATGRSSCADGRTFATLTKGLVYRCILECTYLYNPAIEYVINE